MEVKELFKNLPMSPEDLEFVKNVSEIDNAEHNLPVINKRTLYSIFYLAKQIEQSSKSNDKNAGKMFWLTLVIGLFGVVQLAELILKLCNVIQ